MRAGGPNADPRYLERQGDLVSRGKTGLILWPMSVLSILTKCPPDPPTYCFPVCGTPKEGPLNCGNFRQYNPLQFTTIVISMRFHVLSHVILHFVASMPKPYLHTPYMIPMYATAALVAFLESIQALLCQRSFGSQGMKDGIIIDL